jgi:hypothetical protein
MNETNITKQKKYECIRCKRSFSDETGLYIHYRRTLHSYDTNNSSQLTIPNNLPHPSLSHVASASGTQINESIIEDTFDELSFHGNHQGGEIDTSPIRAEWNNQDPDPLSTPPQPYNESVTDHSVSVDSSSLNRYINHVSNKTSTLNTPTTYQSDIELIHMLQKANAPINLYEQIQNWARTSFAINPDVFRRVHMSRSKLLKLIETTFDSAGCYPQPKTIYLPFAQRRITIQTFDFAQAIYSLLTDPVLMREENLDLDTIGNENTNNLYPFPKPAMFPQRTHDFQYKEFSDGDLYCIANQTHCPNTRFGDSQQYIHLPLIIIGQLDKTFIDSKGKLTLEPFKISLHIFKEKIRRLDIAWRPLGYISNQANLPAYKHSQDKAQDYHVILGQIIHSLKDYQSIYDAFLWDMQIRNKMVHIAFKPVFGFIIGDNEGHDKTCGKYLNRMNVNRLCRYCDTPLHRSDDPFYQKWKYTSGSLIENLVENQKNGQLKEMSYHCINNAMQGVVFADPKRGINGATPAERLHLLNHGLFQFILDYNFGQKRAKKTKQKCRMLLTTKHIDDHSDSSDTDVSNSSSETSDKDIDFDENEFGNSVHGSSSEVVNPTKNTNPNISNISLFTPAICDRFDLDAKQYGRILQKQSSRYWNRSFFYQGVTSNSKKVGHEERNCLMLCLLIYTSSRHDFYSSLLDPKPSSKRSKISNDSHKESPIANRLDYLIELISETLLLEEFMMQKSIPKSTLVLVQKYIPLYLNFLKQVCPRDKGMGWKLTKFHILLHIASDIQRLSIPMNFDSNVVESHHKHEKKSGNRTQMRASNLEKQTALRRTEHMLIQRAYNNIHPPASLLDHDDTRNAEDPKNDHHMNLSSMKMVYIQNSGIHLTNKYGTTGKRISIFPGSDFLCPQLCEFLGIFFSKTTLPSTGAPIYTRLTINHHDCDDVNQANLLYRGDPLWTTGHIGPKTVDSRGKSMSLSLEDNEQMQNSDPWHDFAYVRWLTNTSQESDGFTIIPARIILFLVIPDGCEGEDEDAIVYGPGAFAIVQSCVEELNAYPPTSTTSINYYTDRYGSSATFDNYLAHPSCSILFWTLMELTSFPTPQTDVEGDIPDQNIQLLCPKLYVTSISNICGSCIAVPYNLDQSPTLEWIIVRNRDEWDENFIDDMKVRLGM